MEAQHHPRLVFVRLFVVGDQQEDQRAPVNAYRRLDHIGRDMLARLVVEVGEVLVAGRRVPAQVEVGAAGDAL